MAKVDLDAIAARSEGKRETHTVTVGGVDFELVPEMPLEFAELLNEARMTEAVRCLLVNPEEAQLMLSLERKDSTGKVYAHGIQLPELEQFARLYETDLPESSASSGRSLPTLPRSRPTFSGSTGSISEQLAGGRTA